MKRCPNCGKQFPDDANFCPGDAGRLEPDAGDTHRGVAPGGANPAEAPVVADALSARFDLGGAMGGGVTGEVFHARDREVGAVCAVKLVHASVFPNPLLLQRAERELKQLERLQLPEVVRVLAHGRRGEQLWIAMELVGGMSLDKIVAQGGPLQPVRACRIVRAVAHGLAEAAKQGVIHRDLAPKNILIETTGVLDSVKIINFSIATPFSDRVQGAAEFLSPEQVDGKPADQRSSIYSLGALLYFAVAGRPPFAGEAAAVHRAHAQEAPPPLSQLTAVPPQLEQIVMRALEKASAKRYMTLQQFIGELDSFLTTGGATAAVVAPGQAQGKPLSQAPAATMMGVGGKSPFGAVPGVGPAAAPQPFEAPASQPVYVQPPVQAPQPAQPPQPVPMAVPPMQPMQPMQLSPQQQMTPPLGYGAGPGAGPGPGAAKGAGAGAGAGKGKGKGGKEKPAAEKGKFRETMWFKKGELDAAAAQAAAAAKEGDLVLDKVDALPNEDRYKDDGSIGRQDAEKFSLRTGATQMNMQAVRPGQVGPDVSTTDLAAEMKTGRGLIIALLLIGLAGVVGVIVYFVS
ncbi:MAG TPA: serine/threonine-protein kinase [Kofleriaceae bacterium]|nr:serine/threonine-protein kinase [Kofleriaceae bacterium]